MTADGEPPTGHPDHATHDGCCDALLVTGGASTLLGELESLERFVKLSLGKLGRNPCLHRVNVRELLQEVAYRRWDVSSGTATMVELVAASGRLEKLPELGDAERRAIIVTQLFGDSGILVAEDGDFRFGCQAVQKYLAVCHIVGRHPRGPGWRQLRAWKYWKYLEPQPTWPWPDLMMSRFLAALWWRVAPSDVARRLRHLLHDRHRDQYIEFVVELIGQGIGGSDVRNHTVDLLCRDLVRQKDLRRWRVIVGCLHQLDPTVAIAELEKLNKFPGPTIDPLRRFDAIIELKEYDSARVPENLEVLVHSLTVTGTPEGWLNAVLRIHSFKFESAKQAEWAKQLAKQAMLRLADTDAMGELRKNAAINTNSLPMMCKLIGDCSLSDEARLELSAEVLKWDPSMAVGVMVPFARTAREDRTPLEIAKMLIQRPEPYRPVALQIAREVAWPANPRIDSWVRLDAVILIGEIDPAQAIPKLEDLSKDPSVTDEVAFIAARRIVTEHDKELITALVKFGLNSNRGLTYRVKAAEFVRERDFATCAQIYISIAKTCRLEDPRRPKFLEKAYKLAPEPATEALAKDALDGRVPGEIRLKCVEIAKRTLGTHRTIDLYTEIARTTKEDTAALTAVRKVGAMAREAGTYGTRALMALATAQSYTVRLQVALELRAIGRKKEAEAVLQELVKTREAGTVRIGAALALPEAEAVDALITITEDPHAKEIIRSDARQELRKLATAQGISETTRKKVLQYLNK